MTTSPSTEPVGALSTTGKPLDPSLVPRRAYVGDSEYNLVFLGLGLASLAVSLAIGVSPVFAGAGALVGAFVGTWAIDRTALAARATARFNATCIPADEAAARGRWEEAERVYRSLAERYRSRPGLHGVALFKVAMAIANRGDVATAVSMLIVLDGYKRAKRQPLMGRPLANMIALLCAQLKRIDEARRWLTTSRAGPGKFYDAHIDATILMREERWTDALDAFDREWRDLERCLPVDALREIAARRAFVLERLGRDDDAARAVATIDPSRSDELESVGFEWPELADFLRRRRLVTK